MPRTPLLLAIVALACAETATEPRDPPPASLAGTWRDAQVTFYIGENGAALNGSVLLTSSAGPDCLATVAGAYFPDSVDLRFDGDLLCEGRFIGKAHGTKITGRLTTRYTPPTPGAAPMNVSRTTTLTRDP